PLAGRARFIVGGGELALASAVPLLSSGLRVKCFCPASLPIHKDQIPPACYRRGRSSCLAEWLPPQYLARRPVKRNDFCCLAILPASQKKYAVVRQHWLEDSTQLGILKRPLDLPRL